MKNCDKGFYYKFIGPDEVDPKKRERVEEIIERFKQIYRQRTGSDLPPFEIRWFIPTSQAEYESDKIYQKILEAVEKIFETRSAGLPEKFRADVDDFIGLFHAKKAISENPERIIYLRSDLTLHELDETLAHELAHLIYFDIFKQHPLNPIASQQSELFAQRFEKKFLKLIKD